MTEKRFTLHKGLDTINIMDNTKFGEQIYINKSSKDMKCLVGLLNELAEENDKLKQEIKGFEGCSHNWGLLYDEAKNKVEELSKENQELKQSIRVIYDLIDGYIAIADKYRKPIKSLSLGDDLGYWNGVYQYMKKLRERAGVL